MTFSRVDQVNLGLMAQFQTGIRPQFGGATQEPSEKVNEVTAQTTSATQGFNWRKLNLFDNKQIGATSNANIGKTSEVPTGNVYGLGGGSATPKVAYTTPNDNLFAALNRIDARDIALNSNKNGFEGQSHINFLA